MKKRVWTMTDMCLVNQRVDFGEEVTKEQAIEMWLAEEYADVLDIDIVEMNDNYGAK